MFSVFQAKVLQRLYPLPRKPVKEPSPLHTLESVVVKTQHVKQKACEGAVIGKLQAESPTLFHTVSQ